MNAPAELTEFIPENIHHGLFRTWELKTGEYGEWVEIRNSVFSRKVIAGFIALVVWIALVLGIIITVFLRSGFHDTLPKPVIIAFACLSACTATGIIIAGFVYMAYSASSLWKGGLRFRYDQSSGEIFFPRENARYARNEYDELILGMTDGYNTVKFLEERTSTDKQQEPPLIKETYFLVRRKDGTWVRHLVGYDGCSKAVARAVEKIQAALTCQIVTRTMTLQECYATQHKTVAAETGIPASVASEVPAPPKPKQKSLIPAYCFLSIFVAAGLAFFGFGLIELSNARASLAWPSCEGTVTQSKVEQHHSSGHRGGGNSKTYGPSIHYDYIVDGIPYTGKKYCYVPVFTSDSGPAQKIVDEHPVGSTVTVYYAADAPEKSVLVPGPNKGVYFLLIFSLVFTLIAIGLMLLVRSNANRDKTKLTRPYQASEPDFRG